MHASHTRNQALTLSRVTAAAGVLILLLTMSALAQTTDRHPVQQPTLADQIDTRTGHINGNLSEMRGAILKFAADADALRQQLAEANQQIAAKDKQIADLTKERDALKTEKPAPEPTK